MNSNKLTLILIAGLLFGCTAEPLKEEGSFTLEGFETRSDKAVRVTNGPGSDQNPAFLTENIIVFTHFKEGYNKGPSALMGLYVNNLTEFVLWQDEAQNVNINGNPFTDERKKLCYASDVEDADEIWCLSLLTQERQRMTRHLEDIHFIEPSVSHDGKQITFEVHVSAETDSPGQIWVTDLQGNYHPLLNDSFDNRLPMFSPTNNRILFQRRGSEFWRLHVLEESGSLTEIPIPTKGGTDASWASASEIVYSSEEDVLPYPQIYSYDLVKKTGRRETYAKVEDGAPAVSLAQRRLAFESHLTEDETTPTRIWIKARP